MQKIRRRFLTWLVLAGLIGVTCGITGAWAQGQFLDRAWGDYT